MLTCRSRKHVSFRLPPVVISEQSLPSPVTEELPKINGTFQPSAMEWEKWLYQVNAFYRSSKTTAVASPLFISTPEDNRPHLSVRIYGQSFQALLDTGANMSIIGARGISILDKFHVPLLPFSSSLAVTVADGSPKPISGKVNLPIVIDGVKKNVQFLVVPDITISFILGINFCQTFNISLNFKNSSFSACTVQPNIFSINSLQDLSSLSAEEQKRLDRVIGSFNQLVSDKLGQTNVISHHIDTGNAKPFKLRQYPLSPAMQVHLNKEIDEMLELGVIEPSNSPWNSPVLLVKKKDGSYRMCFDGRKLNEVTIKDTYPLPLIDSIFNKLRDSRYLSSIDLRKAFWQVPLDKLSRPKTTFQVHGRGSFQFTSMPFGLSNSPQTMQRLMDTILGPSLEPYVFVYLDDIIIATNSFDQHLEILREVQKRLKNAGLTINLDKCEFCRSSLAFLGFVVDKDGLHTDSKKISSIVDAPIPSNTTEVRRVCGLLGWYRKFIKDYSTISAPITALLQGRKKGQPIQWTKEADAAFRTLKERLVTAPVLASPDFSLPFCIQTDASDVGIGAVLFQTIDGFEHPIAYASRTLTKQERKYSVTERECLAVLFGVEHFRAYVEGTPNLTVFTDHASLLWLHHLKEPTGRLARWCLRLSQFSFEIKHRKGANNIVADFLSRHVSSLSLSELQPDEWYKDMLSKVTKNPTVYPDFRVDNGILYKHVRPCHNITSNLSPWKMVVPTPNRTQILHQCHDDPTAAHLGFAKTLARVAEFYYWPKMRKTIFGYVRNCHICAAHKSSTEKPLGLMGNYKNINFPFQLISLDIMGPFPRSKHGNQYLLVVTDWFTKFVFVHPLRKAITSSIVRFLEQNVFLIYGVPQIMVCDNGSQFIAKDFSKFLDSYGVQAVWYNAKYHPQINHTERVNKVIITAIASYIKDSHKTWDENIHHIAQAIRLAKHDVTGFSPSFLVFGRHTPLSGSFYGKVADNPHNIPDISDQSQWIDDIHNLPPLFHDVRFRLKKAYESSKVRYDLRRRPLSFTLGDLVWKRSFVLSDASKDFKAKLSPKYILCKVAKVVGNLVYELADLTGKALGRWHVKDLKPYKGDNPNTD